MPGGQLKLLELLLYRQNSVLCGLATRNLRTILWNLDFLLRLWIRIRARWIERPCGQKRTSGTANRFEIYLWKFCFIWYQESVGALAGKLSESSAEGFNLHLTSTTSDRLKLRNEESGMN